MGHRSTAAGTLQLVPPSLERFTVPSGGCVEVLAGRGEGGRL
jgi:hypothetical protein